MDESTVLAEEHVRARLGIPRQATEVVVVAESSHWDPNWLLTSDRYYRLCVRPTLDRAIDELVAEPRRVYSLECVFFVDRYWQDRRDRHAQIRDLVNAGRLRFSGCGVTTPDTLLPEDELLLRDLLVGQEWLRERGMTQEPRLLYLPDSFGHSPGLPALLGAAGIEYAAVCRIDGMRFPGADLERAARFPRPGSSAAHLIGAGTADFVWRSGDGSEVLTHWMAHGYGHGDMIASGGVSRVMGLPVSWPDRRTDRVDGRIEAYLDDLRPLARTPYRLLAIGFDFVRPVPRLVELLDDWNERHYGDSGTWLVNAGVDDYLDLVAGHRGNLPTIELDPNPYWMGFYATRPDIKRSARDLGRRLVAVDAARAAATLVDDRPDGVAHDPGEEWWTAVTSNHHDFVTGTAPDRVARGEQARWLESATAATPWPEVGTAGHPGESSAAERASLTVRHDGRLVVVVAPWGTAAFDPQAGGSLVALTDAAGDEMISGPSLEVASYAESGGLWRMGHELNGGRWSCADRSSRRGATVDVDLAHDGTSACVTVHALVDGRTATLRHTFHADEPTIVTATSVHAPPRRTVTLVVRQDGAASTLTMHQPGGLVERPLHRWYEPTFWPLHSFAATSSAGDGPRGPRLVVATADPTGLHVEPDGTTEVVVARTAVKEIAFGVVPVMAPAWGRGWGRQEAVLAFGWAESSDPRAIERGRRLVRAVDRAAGRPMPALPVVVEDPDIDVIAVKRAHRGGGLIVRLRNWAHTGAPRSVSVGLLPGADAAVVEARLVDSRERDQEPLRVVDGRAEVPIDRYCTTVRLVVDRGGDGADAT